MKIAIFADIQGNAVALEAALRDMQRHAPDVYICLGDLVTGAQPTRCLQLLREVNCRVVQGNMDASVLSYISYTGDDVELHHYAEIDQWCYQQLSADDRYYLASLPAQIEVDTAYGRLLCVHGSPIAFDDVIDATTPENQLTQMMTGYEADILAVGHMHTPMLRTVQGMTIINPGSIGLPYGAHRPMPCRAQYVLLQDGAVRFHTIDYDVAIFRKALMESDMPHHEWFASKWQI